MRCYKTVGRIFVRQPPRMKPSTVSAMFIAIAALISSSAVEAIVPFNRTFTYVNAGDFGIYISEYGADYRALEIFTHGFLMLFYNTTPSAYTLALRMGTRYSESRFIFVWEANRGKPVGENAVFSLGRDGNLLLREADGRTVWQSNTANKGVVDYNLLHNGNFVLLDAKGKFVWQSFDSPTDTLLVGQSLRVGGVTKLVSRASWDVNVDGPYSLELEPSRIALYYTSPIDSKRYVYFSSTNWFNVSKGPMKQITLASTVTNAPSYEISLNYQSATTSGKMVLSRPEYNASLSYMRLGIEGNLYVRIFNDDVDWGAWEVTFSLFGKSAKWQSECELPSRCLNYGLCENNMCVSCPQGQPDGSDPFLAWHVNCTAQKVKSCSAGGIEYYQLAGVEHFSTQYTKGEGPMTREACFKKCTADCKCLGFFFKTLPGTCWTVGDLMTLRGGADPSISAFIKFSK